MPRELLPSSYLITIETLSAYPKQPKKSTYFELIYILSGNGSQCFNDHKLRYRPGDMFLKGPNDTHNFSIEKTTEFFFLRFDDNYLKSNGFINDHIQKFGYLLQRSKQIPGTLLKNETDKILVGELLTAIITEQIKKDTCWERLTSALVNTLIVIVARNIGRYLPEHYDTDKEDKIIDILHYIQTNIYDPQLIKAEIISDEFGISIKYIGRYFKKHTGSTLQDYIADYKIKLIDNRLLYSAMTLSEIGRELGFADESHFNKFFRKHKGINPSEFRNTAVSTQNFRS